MEGEQANEESALNTPLVFQCSKCRCIVGDTDSMVASDQELASISLSKVSGIKSQDDNLLTSNSGHDRGSTYTQLFCTMCKALLGKVYLTTPRHLDSIRDLYTLDVQAIQSYALGSGEVESEVHGKTLGELTNLRQVVVDMQQMFLLHDERISVLENLVKSLGIYPPKAPGSEKDKKSKKRKGSQK